MIKKFTSTKLPNVYQKSFINKRNVLQNLKSDILSRAKVWYFF